MNEAKINQIDLIEDDNIEFYDSCSESDSDGSNDYNSDSDDSNNGNETFNIVKCQYQLEQLLKFDTFLLCNIEAVFIPTHIYDTFIKDPLCFDSIGCTWDYDLHINNGIEPMKLVWMVPNDLPFTIEVPFRRQLKKPFKFLHPRFLNYMDEPFYNPNAILLVNLILDYHRTQKREIFNISDLINFKMAIDDNRYEYENCEFHKLIDSMLDEAIKSKRYDDECDTFHLNMYLGDKQCYNKSNKIILEYLMYHFQQTIKKIGYYGHAAYPTKLSNIENIYTFLYRQNTVPTTPPTILIRETDPSGTCSEILYELLIKFIKPNVFQFETNQWFYSGNYHQTELLKIIQRLCSCSFIIINDNLFNFIENFINWLKISFGKMSNDLNLELGQYKTIKPFILIGLWINVLTFDSIEVNSKLIEMLKMCNYRSIEFMNCTLHEDLSQRFDLDKQSPKDTPNIFELLDELINVKVVNLKILQNTIMILFNCVSSIMEKNTIYKLKYLLVINGDKPVIIDHFRKSRVNDDLELIEAYSDQDTCVDFYKDLNGLMESRADEFDFYT